MLLTPLSKIFITSAITASARKMNPNGGIMKRKIKPNIKNIPAHIGNLLWKFHSSQSHIYLKHVDFSFFFHATTQTVYLRPNSVIIWIFSAISVYVDGQDFRLFSNWSWNAENNFIFRPLIASNRYGFHILRYWARKVKKKNNHHKFPSRPRSSSSLIRRETFRERIRSLFHYQ